MGFFGECRSKHWGLWWRVSSLRWPLTVATDEVLHVLKVYPPWGAPPTDGSLVLATLYRSVYGILGSYVAARLVASEPMRHAMIVGAIGLC
jgi:hypothetical protein